MITSLIVAISQSTSYILTPWIKKFECNSLNPTLVDIIRFGPLNITVNLTILKRIY